MGILGSIVFLHVVVISYFFKHVAKPAKKPSQRGTPVKQIGMTVVTSVLAEALKTLRIRSTTAHLPYLLVDMSYPSVT